MIRHGRRALASRGLGVVLLASACGRLGFGEATDQLDGSSSGSGSSSVGDESTAATTILTGDDGRGSDSGGGGTGSCCAVQAGPGCDDAAVSACVCHRDRYCCEAAWDDVCVSEVVTFDCGVCLEPGTSGDPTSGGESSGGGEVTTGTTGTSTSSDTSGGTTSGSESSGGGESSSGGVPPDNIEGCCYSHDSTGCEYPSIVDCVCAAHPSCCSDAWAQSCVDAIGQLGCGVCPP